MSHAQFKKGFTLIELLVVIAILAILISITIAVLGSARQKSKVAAVKSELSGLRSVVEIQRFNTSDGGYGQACDHGLEAWPVYQAAKQNLGSNTKGFCNGASNKWAIGVEIDDNIYFCVDAEGFAGEVYSNNPYFSPLQCN